MKYYILSLLFFSTNVIVHILLHRLLVRFGRKTFKTTFIFLFGFILVSFFLTTLPSPGKGENLSWWSTPLPLNAIFLYGIWILLYLIYFGSVVLGEGSPSAEIYYLLTEQGPKSFKKINEEFSDKELIIKRLNNLVEAGLMRKEKERYYPSPVGKGLTVLFDYYRKLLRWNEGG